MNEAAKTLDDHASQAELVRIVGRIESPASSFEVRSENGSAYWRGGSITSTGTTIYDDGGTAESIEGAFRAVAKNIGRSLRPETLEVKAPRAPIPPKQLTALALQSAAQVFGVAIPSDEDLSKLRALYKKEREDERKAKEAAKASNAKRDERRKAKERATRPQPNSKVRDVPSFLEAVEVRVRDKARLHKALSMLKAQRFQLYHDVGSAEIVGVVKSQTDPSLVYGCHLTEEGDFSCCTQNLNTCGGLRGQLCKHILVLVIGLVQTEQLDPALADTWIAASLDEKPKLDKSAMADVFLRYKGAEAGDVDWRPTETLPEDFYAY